LTFDAENLTDVMNEIYKNEVRGKLYRLLYMMNQNTRIRVQTPVGITDAANTGEGLGQGTVEGALASSINLDIMLIMLIMMVLEMMMKFITWV